MFDNENKATALEKGNFRERVGIYMLQQKFPNSEWVHLSDTKSMSTFDYFKQYCDEYGCNISIEELNK